MLMSRSRRAASRDALAFRRRGLGCLQEQGRRDEHLVDVEMREQT
jgi:hypothetical protein